jgi:Xaa-Pro aminopeptidase
MQRRHRQTFLDVLARENAAAVIPAGALRVRNHDCDHRFRPTSDFAYLVDFREPNAWLVLLPGGEARALIFLEEKNLDEETWTGHWLGVVAAPQRLVFDGAFPVARFFDVLPALL